MTISGQEMMEGDIGYDGKKRLTDRGLARLIAFALVVLLTLGCLASLIAADSKSENILHSHGIGVYVDKLELLSTPEFQDSTAVYAATWSLDALAQRYITIGGDPSKVSEAQLIELMTEAAAREVYDAFRIYINSYNDLIMEPTYEDSGSAQESAGGVTIIHSEGTWQLPNDEYIYFDGPLQSLPTSFYDDLTNKDPSTMAALLERYGRDAPYGTSHAADEQYGFPRADEDGIEYKGIHFAIDKILSDNRFLEEHDAIYRAGIPVFSQDGSLQDSSYLLLLKDTNRLGLKEAHVEGVFDAFLQTYSEEIKALRDKLVAEQTQAYLVDIANMGNSDALYYIGYADNYLSNMPIGSDGRPTASAINEVKAAKIHVLIDKDGSSFSGAARNALFAHRPMAKNLYIYYAATDEAIGDMESGYTQARDVLLRGVIIAGVMAILAIISLIWLLFASGRKRQDGSRRLYKWDLVFAEVQLALALGLIYAIASISNERDFVESFMSTLRGQASIPVTIIIAILAMIILCIYLWILLSIIRIVRSGRLANRSLIWKILTFAWRGLTSLCNHGRYLFDRKNPFAKTMVIAILASLAFFCLGLVLSAAVLSHAGLPSMLALFIVLCALLFFTLKFAARRAKRYQEIKDGITLLTAGQLMHRIPTPDAGGTEFDKLARGINEIGRAYDIAIANELKSQRLRTDLISGVSHDLKTPLTSIVTYIDLLQKEGVASDNAEGYLRILSEKTDRLRKLTEDLFDAAKASSGSLHVELTDVDLHKLIKQEMAELYGALSETGLEFVTGDAINAADAFLVRADAKLLWRIVDNLFSNIRKYALPKTRVYIELSDGVLSSGAPAVMLEIKNISATKLNIPVDELMEKFKRGDESRTTDGSGLGLSIAHDLARLMSGEFGISIDGDLFKATLLMPKA